MISTVNLKIFRQLFYFVRFTDKVKHAKYAIFCYKQPITSEIHKIMISNTDISYCFIQKIAKNVYLQKLIPFFHNSMLVFTCQSKTSCLNLINNLQTILFIKIDNKFYSMNNIKDYLNSDLQLVQCLDHFYYSSAIVLAQLSTFKKD